LSFPPVSFVVSIMKTSLGGVSSWSVSTTIIQSYVFPISVCSLSVHQRNNRTPRNWLLSPEMRFVAAVLSGTGRNGPLVEPGGKISLTFA
jgi:hypothetical protein